MTLKSGTRLSISSRPTRSQRLEDGAADVLVDDRRVDVGHLGALGQAVDHERVEGVRCPARRRGAGSRSRRRPRTRRRARAAPPPRSGTPRRSRASAGGWSPRSAPARGGRARRSRCPRGSRGSRPRPAARARARTTSTARRGRRPRGRGWSAVHRPAGPAGSRGRSHQVRPSRAHPWIVRSCVLAPDVLACRHDSRRSPPMPCPIAPERLVVVVDEALPPGLAANAAAVLAFTLGRAAAGLRRRGLRRRRRRRHPGLIPVGLPILRAPAADAARRCASARWRPGVGVVGLPVVRPPDERLRRVPRARGRHARRGPALPRPRPPRAAPAGRTKLTGSFGLLR